MSLKVRPQFIGVALGLLMALAPACSGVAKHIVWDDEIGTDLVWSEGEAYLFVQQRRLGWRGDYVQYAGLALLGTAAFADGDQGTVRTLVLHIGSDAVARTAMPGRISNFTVQNDRLYATYQREWTRWNGTQLVCVSAEELSALRTGRMLGIDVTNVNGWSSRCCILGREGATEFPVEIGGIRHTIVANRYDESRAIDLRRPGRQDERLFLIDRRPRSVSPEEYHKLLELPANADTPPWDKLRHDTAWIHLGDIEASTREWVTHLKYERVRVNPPDCSSIPRAGDEVRLNEDVELLILGYRDRGEDWREYPFGGLAVAPKDRTGLLLRRSSEVRVQHVDIEPPTDGKSGVFVRVRPL